jgi:hypothetical protein
MKGAAMIGIAYITIILALLLGIGIGAIYSRLIKSFFPRDEKREKAEGLALLNSIEEVMKLVTVEGYFSHIMKHTDEKPLIFGIRSTKKR